LPFFMIIFVGIIIFENKIPLSFAKDVSTESTKVNRFDNSKIISGVCHTKSDRIGIALGFAPQKTEKESLQNLDNLIECGLPCFKENGKQQKDLPDSFAPSCCDCCEGKNDLYQEQFFSIVECGDCVKNFIHKSYSDPEVKSCVAEKNKQTNITMGKVQMQYVCYECADDDAGNTTITPSDKGMGSISPKIDDATETTDWKLTKT